MSENRKQYIIVFFLLIAGVYLLRLFYLQVLDSKYRALGSTNSIRKEIQVPLRGQIYDRSGKLLVANDVVFDLYVIPRKVKNLDTTYFCNVFGITKPYFDSVMTIATGFSKIRPSLFLRQISKEDHASVSDAMIKFNGFYFEQSFVRTYPAATLANALGYIAEIPKEKFEEQGEEKYYRKGDYIGLTGLEKHYELDLRGIRGIRYKLMNVKGEDKGPYSPLSNKPTVGEFDTIAVLGKNLYTTIDYNLQKLADSLFQGKVGGVVAIEPATGEILALGSYPSYDPNLLSGRQFSKSFKELSRDPDKPLINRVTNSFYRPGSTFKLIQAAVGLELGEITPRTNFFGSPAPFAYHSSPGFEMANLKNAIQVSSNPFFYNVFKRIIEHTPKGSPFKTARFGLANWHKMVEKFGFGIQLGIDLPNEKAGLLPNVERYDKVYGKEQWKYSNIYSLSIGEGELGTNILKLANMTAAIANKGYWITPHLVKGMGLDVNKMEIPENTRTVHQTGVESRHFDVVIDGMEAVVVQGTGRRAMVDGIAVCGKTGTSQNVKGKDHAIFIAFAPKVNPKIAIAVIVENGGFGGVASAPIAGLMIEQYLKGSVARQTFKEQVMKESYRTTSAVKVNKN